MSQSREITVVQQVCTTIASPEFRQKISEALPPDISADRFIRTALTAIQLKPEVCEADRQSLYNSVIQAAQQRLMPDNREGAIVVYNQRDGDRWIKKAQFQPMVAGIIKRFGEVGILAYAASVYENELPKFRVWNDDTGQHVEHEPIMFGERGKFVGVFAVARTPDGRTYVEAMGVEEIDKVMAASRSKDKQGNPVGPWKDWFDRMAQKSALHRLGRRVPIIDPRADEALRETLDADRNLYDFDQAGQAAATTPAETAQAAPQRGPRRPRALDAVAAQAPASGPENGAGDAIEGEATRIEPDGHPGPDPEAAGAEAHF
jgi:recombination protein RecT